MNSERVMYLRAGRSLRSSGTVVERRPNGMMEVKPTNPGWKRVIVTKEEVEAGSVKPPTKPREAKEGPPEGEVKARQPRKPKAPTVTRGERLTGEISKLTEGLAGKAVVLVEVGFLSEIAEELRETRNLFNFSGGSPSGETRKHGAAGVTQNGSSSPVGPGTEKEGEAA